MFFLFPKVVDVVILLHSFIGSLALSYQIEVVAYENKQGDAHDSTHDINEEKESLHDKQVLYG